MKLFGDTAFISKLREAPWDVPYEKFETEVLSGFLSSVGLRLLVGKRDGNILTEIIKLRCQTTFLQGICLLDCDLANEDWRLFAEDEINRVKMEIVGIWEEPYSQGAL